MCCFSREVEDVSQTRIFARLLPPEKGQGLRQALAYQMRYRAKTALAMILPLPVAPGSGEKAVKFLDLSKAEDLFERLHDCFPAPRNLAGSDSDGAPAAQTLAVEKVGSYEASFVPTIQDFGRLDERFRLPKGTWEKLPGYTAYGFAVFQLLPTATTVHPMAFHFPLAPGAAGLFLPTVHIHDGQVHAKAEFDHTLYLQQTAGRKVRTHDWLESPGHVGAKAKSDYAGLLDREAHVYRRIMTGNLANQDTWVSF